MYQVCVWTEGSSLWFVVMVVLVVMLPLPVARCWLLLLLLLRCRCRCRAEPCCCNGNEDDDVVTTDYMLRLEVSTEPSETGLLGLQLGAWGFGASGCRSQDQTEYDVDVVDEVKSQSEAG